MKKILLPTDFSDNAFNAIGYALNFFKNEDCEFHILHTYTPTFYRIDYLLGGPTYSAIPDTGVDMAQAGLDNTMAAIEKGFKNSRHTFKTLSSFNTLTNEILELTHTIGFDLIVMGTQGATGAKEIFLGTHTVHVIRKSKVPVLVIPKGYGFKKIESILFPSDYANPFHKEDLRFLVYVAQLQKSELKILNIRDEYALTDAQLKNKESLEKLFDGLPYTFASVTGKVMPNAIYEYVEKNKSDLLVMLNRGHSLLERLLVKSNVDAIGYHTKIPFLVLRDSDQAKDKKTQL